VSLLIKGVTNFVGLADTPASYSGQADKLPHVKATEDALEFTPWKAFSKTKIFDGATASPPTRYLKPLTIFPNHTPSGSGGRLQRIFAICVGGYIYVGGGRFWEVVYNKQVWRYKPATGEWARMANLPDNYGFYQQNNVAGYHDGKIYLYANYKAAPYCTKLLEYNIAGNSWTVYDAFGTNALHKTVLACLSDGLYLCLDQHLQIWDYTAHTWSGEKAAPPDEFEVGGRIGDDIYCLGRTNVKTYKYNKGGNSWDDQTQDAPVGLHNGCACYVEDADEIWAYYLNGRVCYKYTTAGGWVSQFTYGRDSAQWDWFLQFSGETKLYAVFGIGGLETSYEDNVYSGSIHTYDPDSLNWELLGVDLTQGDFIVIDTGDVPVLVEKDGVLKWTATGLATFFIMEPGRYLFTLSKDYTYDNTKIWKSVWG